MILSARDQAAKEDTLLRVAIVHDYLTQRGGAERVVLAMLQAFPNARLITSVYNPSSTFPEFASMDIETTSLQKIGAFRQDPRRALPLLAPTFRHIHIRDVDVVICSSAGWAHGVTTSAPKLVYCYNPARWIYQEVEYVSAQPAHIRLAFKFLRPFLRRWDLRASHTAAAYLTTSTTVQGRIKDAYGMHAELLPPPVLLNREDPQAPPADLRPGYFLVVGRARGYKNVASICEAFSDLPAQRLVVVGGLPTRDSGHDWPANLLGYEGIPDAQLRWLYENCFAVIATSHEDFGLTPLEGNTFGRPALVLRAGGFLDTLVEGITGYFIDEPSAEAVGAVVERALAHDWDEERIVKHAEAYSVANFNDALRQVVLETAASQGPPDRT